MARAFISFTLIALIYSGSVSAQLITYEFQGAVRASNSLFNSGDTFSGSYTFESTAPVVPNPDITLATQSQAINAGLVGTSWSIDLFSSAISDFSFSGNNGVIAVGNDGIFGDRYLAILDLGSSLPLGLSITSFQIDLQDLFIPPADLLSDASFASLPNLALAQSAGGLFSINGSTGGCQQCQIEITSLTEASLTLSPVPVPAAVWLFGSGLLGLLGFSRRKLAT